MLKEAIAVDALAVKAKGAKKQYRAPALEKGLDILELLTSEREPLTVSAICQRLKRSQGEIFRMIQVLEDRGFIGQNAQTDGYMLTDLLFSMAMQQPMTQSLVEAAIPIMRILATDIGQSCHLALHTRGEIVVVARMESIEHLGFTVRVGYRRSIMRTVSGMTLFAFQPSDVRERWLAMVEPVPSKQDLTEFIANIEEIELQGFAQRASSYVSGVTDISVPIMRGDRAAAALTVPYIKTTSSRGSTADVARKLKAASEDIARRLTGGDSRA
jgi:DNA-binding IclR family transcriptional regulator